MLGIFLDIETTGLDPVQHRVLEIAFQVIDLRSGKQLASFHKPICQPQEVWDLADPVSLKINGFTWEEVQKGTPQEKASAEILEKFISLDIRRGKALFICQNPAFDRAFFAQLINVYTQEELKWPYHWLDFASMYWAYKVKEARDTAVPLSDSIRLSKDNIAEEQGLPKEEKPHRAMNGVKHLVLCYQSLIGWTATDNSSDPKANATA